jgi:hypothetical protein
MLRLRISNTASFAASFFYIALCHNALAQVAATAQPAPAEYHPGGYPESYTGVGRTFYPGTELRALPVARAQAVAAREQFLHAQTNLSNAIADVHRTFTRSTELRAALAEEKAAWDELTNARDAALSRLSREEQYQAAVQLRDRMAHQIEQARAQKDTQPQQLLAMASVKLSYSASVTAMEAGAIAADPYVAQARQRLVAAGAKIAELREIIDDAVRRDPQVLAARKAVQETQTAAAATDALYLDATRVADAALDFAYFLQTHSAPYVVNSPYYYGGYGYGSVSYPVGYPIGYPLWNAPQGR